MGAVESAEAVDAAGGVQVGSKAIDANVLCDQLADLADDLACSKQRSRNSSKPRTSLAANVIAQHCVDSSSENDNSDSASDESDGPYESSLPGACPAPAVFEAAGVELRTREEFRVKFLSKLNQSGAWVPSVQRPPRHQTVIIFDWDDTLLCTSFLVCSRAKYREELPKETQLQLRKIAKAVGQLLELATRLGQTFIITNAEEGWVETSAASFLPELQPGLHGVRVISARSRYEPEYPGQAAAWKEQAFLEVRRQLEVETVGNLISIGDSVFEMDAVAVMGQEFAESCIKTVRFRQQPMPGQLLQELNLVLNKLQQIVAGPKDLKLTFEAASRVQARH
mmetsp:Transcript_71913/g.185488  ORF Transcript_71913/g.185488 Transcript_71913/m.185488 type:complete len:338 (-) Transcript_71913:173-1186(-)